MLKYALKVMVQPAIGIIPLAMGITCGYRARRLVR